MKKFSIVLAMVLVLALTASTFAGSFADVPSNHWAYNAVNKLVATGLITGYADGTYRGQKTLTRYEIAVVLSRLLNDIEEARAELVDQVDFMVNDALIKADSGLSQAEGEEVVAIVEAVLAKNNPEVAAQKDLSVEQAAEVMDIVKALTSEFDSELYDLGVDVAVLREDVDALQADASKDSVNFTGSIDNYFQVANYGDNPATTAEVWSDGDALDIGLPELDDDGKLDEKDKSDFPAEKAFYQKIDLKASAEVNNIAFDLELDTIANTFTKTDGVPYRVGTKDVVLGEQDNESNWTMDNALLSVTSGDYLVKLGDLNGFDVAPYFIDDEDMEGLDLTTSVAGFDLRGFVVGKDYDNDNDYYGFTATTDLGLAKVTGKLFQGRLEEEEVTDFAVAAEANVSDALTVKGEVVANSVKENDTSDTLINLGADYVLSDIITLRGGFETVGEEFNSAGDVLADLEEDNNYNKFTVGADYILDANNTVKGDYTLVSSDYDDKPEDKNIIEVGIENIMGAFTNTASVKFVQNDEYKDTDDDVTVIKLGTEYSMSDLTTVKAGLVNKSADVDELSYNYLTAGLNHKLSDNINWETDVQYLTGEKNDIDAEGNALTTKLSVSF